MKFKTHNDMKNTYIPVHGTSLQGYIDISYDKLSDVFGKALRTPMGDGLKTDWEWNIRFKEEGWGGASFIVTIYNYKDGPNYGYDVNRYDIQRWHIGGHGPEAIACVRKATQDKFLLTPYPIEVQND